MAVILVVGQTAYAVWGKVGFLGFDLSAEAGDGFVFENELIDEILVCGNKVGDDSAIGGGGSGKVDESFSGVGGEVSGQVG